MATAFGGDYRMPRCALGLPILGRDGIPTWIRIKGR